MLLQIFTRGLTHLKNTMHACALTGKIFCIKLELCVLQPYMTTKPEYNLTLTFWDSSIISRFRSESTPRSYIFSVTTVCTSLLGSGCTLTYEHRLTFINTLPGPSFKKIQTANSTHDPFLDLSSLASAHKPSTAHHNGAQSPGHCVKTWLHACQQCTHDKPLTIAVVAYTQCN